MALNTNGVLDALRAVKKAAIHSERLLPLAAPRVFTKEPFQTKARRWDLASFGESEIGRKLAESQNYSYIEVGTPFSRYSYTRFPGETEESLYSSSTLWLCKDEGQRLALVRAGALVGPEDTNSIRALVNSPLLREKLRVQQGRELALQGSTVSMPKVTVICPTFRPQQITHVQQQFSQQLYPHKELLILTHGFEYPGCLSLPKAASLGECLNVLVNAAGGDLIARFDDDDYYLPHYLGDQVAELQRTGADLIGKSSNYVYLASRNVLARRKPGISNGFVDFVSGPTFLGRKETFLDTPFRHLTKGEDTAFLDDIQRADKRIYSNHPFNFVLMRHGNHTWNAADDQLLANSIVETFGLNLEHAEA